MPNQQKLDELFMNVAHMFASKMSTCKRVKVGAVLVKNNRIISTGYNGVAPKHTHCEDVFKDVIDITSQAFLDDHAEFSKKYEFHAEMNAIHEAMLNGINIIGSTMYCTTHPCFDCLKHICRAKISKIIYDYPYDRITLDNDFMNSLATNGIEIIRFNRL